MQTIKTSVMLILLILAIINQACKKNKVVDPAPPQPKKYVVTTFAGSGDGGFADGPVLSAKFNSPLDVAVRRDGTVLVADLFNKRIRRIINGEVTTFAGSGTSDTFGGLRTSASFKLPSRLAFDNLDNVYSLDAGDPRVRKIDPSGFVANYAGSGVKGFLNGVVLDARFGQAFGIVTDAQGNVYISDSENNRIRKVSVTGEVTTIAGTGDPGLDDGDGDHAKFNFPEGLAIDGQGNLYVADFNRIRKITPAGFVSTLAGSATPGFKDGGPAEAQFILIEDMVIDAQGNLYVSDNNRIRKVSPQGTVITIAGTGDAGFKDGDALDAKFDAPQGLGIDRDGNIYVADINNHRIRKISFQ